MTIKPSLTVIYFDPNDGTEQKQHKTTCYYTQYTERLEQIKKMFPHSEFLRAFTVIEKVKSKDTNSNTQDSTLKMQLNRLNKLIHLGATVLADGVEYTKAERIVKEDKDKGGFKIYYREDGQIKSQKVSSNIWFHVNLQ